MTRRGSLVAAIAAGVAVIAVACSGGNDAVDDVVQATPEAATATAAAAPAQTEVAATATPTATQAAGGGDPLEPPFTGNEHIVAERLRYNFSMIVPERRTIDLEELVQGQVPDGIPAIDNPQFGTFDEVAEWLGEQEPVVSLEVNGDARAYPLQILIWHEIVNDTVGDTPVLVTFCPLCNTALSFDRRVDGAERIFGVSGFLRRSDLIMYDRETQTLWQQIGGDAIVGIDTSKRLDFIPSPIVSFAEFKETFPDGVVLTRDTGFAGRPYGENPYAGYDRVGGRMLFPVDEFGDFRLDAKERVLTVEIDGDAIAFPFSVLSEQVVIEADVGGQPVVAFWQSGALSALDAFYIIGSANVGAAAAYSPLLDGERLTFEARDGQIVDTQSGSTWNVLGHATAGSMAGRSLEPVVSANHFWFAWSVFQPDTRVVGLDTTP